MSYECPRIISTFPSVERDHATTILERSQIVLNFRKIKTFLRHFLRQLEIFRDLRSLDNFCSIEIHHSIINVGKNDPVRYFSELCAQNVYFGQNPRNLREFKTIWEECWIWQDFRGSGEKSGVQTSKKIKNKSGTFSCPKGSRNGLLGAENGHFAWASWNRSGPPGGPSRGWFRLSWSTFNYYL